MSTPDGYATVEEIARLTGYAASTIRKLASIHRWGRCGYNPRVYRLADVDDWWQRRGCGTK